MRRNIISGCLLALSTLICINSFANGEKPLDAFISRVKETNTFVTVTNIWQPDNIFDQKDILKNVERAQPLTINYTEVASLLQKGAKGIDLVVPGIHGGSYTLELARYDFFTSDFEVHEMGANGDKLLDYKPGLYYRGVVKGIPGSVVAFSFFKNEVYGIFSIPEQGNYVLVPNTLVGEYYNYNQNYILYNDNELKIKDQAPGCSADRLPEIHTAHRTTTIANNNVYNNCTEVRCYEVADYSMYVKKGSTVANSANYITALFNNKSTIYKNEGVPIELKYIQVNSVTDQYQSLVTSLPPPRSASLVWLKNFGGVTQNNMHGCDVATLFTTKGGSMGGVAWLGSMCISFQPSDSAGPYAFCNINNSNSLTVTAFPTYSWDVIVCTHEMGHNVGSPHTHACAWGPARNYAIDSCYTLEGPCIAPAGRPSGTIKGTIMSYCHLISSIGISFTNGFGQQPGDTVRYFLSHVFSSSCGTTYHPGTALSTPVRTISANRECTDMNTGITYYWNDHNTASHADDTIVLMIRKNGNNIGSLDSAGFAVSASTDTGFGSGSGFVTTFPAGTPGTGTTNVAMRRYWSVTPKAQPTTNVEVIYPFTVTDSADVDGSISGAPLLLTNFRMYKVNSPTSPNPSGGFAGATTTSFSVYTNAVLPSTTNWSLTRSGDTCFAHMLMTNLSGGGTGFYANGVIEGVSNIQQGNANISVYPNPTNDKWFVSISGTVSEEMIMQLFAADGKLICSQALQTNSANTVNAANLPVGMYYYRIISSECTYTGSLMKK